MHAHCWRGGGGNGSVALAFAAVGADGDGDDFALALDGAWAGGGARREWHLTPANATAGARSTTVACNGEPLHADDATGAIYGLAPRALGAGAGAVRVAAASVGFVVLPDARAPACMAPATSPGRAGGARGGAPSEE